MTLNRFIAIIGPTASGKTELSLELAVKLKAEIISADSRQIYQGMNIGTAKPSKEEQKIVPHYLIDIIKPDQSYNAGKFIQDADKIIEELSGQGKTIIVQGGTGLYLKALIKGLINIPDIDQAVKLKVAEFFKNKGLAGCYQELKKNDPETAARLHPNDISRILRALEVFWQTEQTINDWQHNHGFNQRRYEVFFLGTRWDRQVLYERINKRVVQMIELGLLDETENLMKNGYHSQLPSMNTIGYKQACQYLLGLISHEQMVYEIQQKSRLYAKKQITWYRNDNRINWLDENKLGDQQFIKLEDYLSMKKD